MRRLQHGVGGQSVAGTSGCAAPVLDRATGEDPANSAVDLGFPKVR